MSPARRERLYPAAGAGALLLAFAAALWLLLVVAAPAHAQDAPPALTPEQSQQAAQQPAVDLGAAGRETAHALFSGWGPGWRTTWATAAPPSSCGASWPPWAGWGSGS